MAVRFGSEADIRAKTVKSGPSTEFNALYCDRQSAAEVMYFAHETLEL